MNRFKFLFVCSTALLISVNAHASSADAFNKFIESSPSAQAELKKVGNKEEITAGCMYSATETHQGFTVTKNGNIYEWSKSELDKENPNRKLIKNDQRLTNKVFDLADSNDFDKASLDYEINGTSYCYVTRTNGSISKTINWPRNEIMGKGKKVPENAREVFNEVINTGAKAMGLIPEN